MRKLEPEEMNFTTFAERYPDAAKAFAKLQEKDIGPLTDPEAWIFQAQESRFVAYPPEEFTTAEQPWYSDGDAMEYLRNTDKPEWGWEYHP